jgi:Transposase
MGVIIGMDPHKRPATIEVTGERAVVLAAGRYGTDTAGYAQMLAAARRFAGRVWAVEGCNGIGRHLAHRLVHDGEIVFDVPPKLSAQVRVFATGNGRKTDPVDAHSVALVALHTPGLVQVHVEEDQARSGAIIVPGRTSMTCGNALEQRLYRAACSVRDEAAMSGSRCLAVGCPGRTLVTRDGRRRVSEGCTWG